MALDIAQLSGELAVRRLGAEDVPQILTLCSGNPQFYRYHPPMASEDGMGGYAGAAAGENGGGQILRRVF